VGGFGGVVGGGGGGGGFGGCGGRGGVGGGGGSGGLRGGGGGPGGPGYIVLLITPIMDLSPLPCFKEGSRILTNKGYIPIEQLRKGNLVKTFMNDYKAIQMIGKKEIYHPASQERIKDQLYQYSQHEYPEVFEPLVITGLHSILIDHFESEEQKNKIIEILGGLYGTDTMYFVPAFADHHSSVYETPGTYTIYHLALENDDCYNNYGIYANGLLVETCSIYVMKEFSNMNLIE